MKIFFIRFFYLLLLYFESKYKTRTTNNKISHICILSFETMTSFIILTLIFPKFLKMALHFQSLHIDQLQSPTLPTDSLKWSSKEWKVRESMKEGGKKGKRKKKRKRKKKMVKERA